MYKIPMLIALSIFAVLLVSISENESNPNTKIVSGSMIQSPDHSKTFFIQDFESGDVIELAFENEISADLTFEDFFNVEISGSYNRELNILTVEEIIMLEDNIQLEALLEN